MNRRSLWAMLGVAIVLAGVLGWMRFATPLAPQGNLAGASLGGPLPLTTQDGVRFDDATLQGRWRLVYFGYTFCPDVCPTDVALLARGLKGFEASDAGRAAKVQPLFITIDPARDTPAALKPFVAAFHPRLIGLTGTPAELAPVLKAYGVYARRMPGGDAENYLMDHSAMLYLFGPTGAPIAFLPHEGLSAEAITQMLATHVR